MLGVDYCPGTASSDRSDYIQVKGAASDFLLCAAWPWLYWGHVHCRVSMAVEAVPRRAVVVARPESICAI
jgi:hypothetical protein